VPPSRTRIQTDRVAAPIPASPQSASDLLERALRDNDPYRSEQPLDLDVYAARYAQQVTR
jgi:hypothetical protein